MSPIISRLMFITFAFQTILSLSRPVSSLYALELGASTLEVGILTATYSFFPLLFAIRVGKLADRFGDRWPILIGFVTLTIGLLMPYLFPAIWALFLSQVVVGISHIVANISLQNMLGHKTTNESRDHYFGLFATVASIGQFAGPVIGGYVSELYGYTFVYIVAAIISFLLLIPSLGFPNIIAAKETAAPDNTNSLALLRSPMLRNALAISALVLYSREIFTAYFPLYGKQLGLSDSMIGWIIAIMGLAMVVVRLFMSRITGIFGRERTLLLSIVVAGLAFVVVPFAGYTYFLMLLSALMGAGLGFGQPLSMSTIYNASPANKTGEVLGLRLAINRLSQLIAPLFFGLVGTWMGVVAVFYVSGAFLLGGAYLARPNPAAKEERTMHVN